MALFLPILLAAAVVLYIIRKRNARPPPGFVAAPGPEGLPVLGNAHQLGPTPHRQIQQWAREYGEVYRIRLGWNDWYMICSPDAVKEIMDKQSVHTSSRAPMPVANEALSGGMRFLFMSYGSEWRKLRSISHKLLTPKASDLFQPSQEWEAKLMLEEILKGSRDGERGTEAGYKAVRRYTVSVIMTSTYGRRIPEWECNEVSEIYGIMNDFSNAATPGKYLADTIPPLGNLPPRLQWWRPSFKPLFDRQANLWMSFWTSLKTQMEIKQAPECFVKQVIENGYENQGISELQAAFLAGSLIEAGSETTSAALNTAILYLAANPSVRAQAHEELDRIVGSRRSPTFADEKDLPFIRAIVKETMRVRPVTNIGTPHYTTAPIMYKNMYIPANSIVAIQQYAIHYDPALFPSPDTFNPSRYLSYPDKAGVYAAGDAASRDHWNFGAGRRICSGMHLAENSMFIVLAKILWAFDILPPLGEDGREVEVDVSDGAFEAGGNTVPKAYRVRWVVRGEQRKELVEREAEVARKEGYVLRGEKVDA
ncbi:cytochrome P450 [Amniculicola lignicola CBS 123094]|uniref:Cytochrome P450 n=1 Tax=Amniculicola lignicola CBS 123094 TaxID=1392246 RepID=A0A6A5WGA1_9PLEO|nr:cytochrome P450 [Amniculicola lignicola CBS 123094]